MYAIVRCGGRQEKASVDDVLTVDKMAGEAGSTVTLPAVLVVDDGTVVSDPAELSRYTVTAEILGTVSGPKINMVHYRSKTGYKRRLGHRQRHTQVKITAVTPEGGQRAASGAAGTGSRAASRSASGTGGSSTAKAERSGGESGTGSSRAGSSRSASSRSESGRSGSGRSGSGRSGSGRSGSARRSTASGGESATRGKPETAGESASGGQEN